ncbi:MAG: hypothetical protein R2879_22865 [Saprospiraceae bacterium]
MSKILVLIFVLNFIPSTLLGQKAKEFYLLTENDSVRKYVLRKDEEVEILNIINDSHYNYYKSRNQVLYVSAGMIDFIDRDTFYLKVRLDSVFSLINKNKYYRNDRILIPNLDTCKYYVSFDEKILEVPNTARSNSEVDSSSNYEKFFFGGLIPDSLKSRKFQFRKFILQKDLWNCKKNNECNLYNPCKGVVTYVQELEDEVISVEILHGHIYSYIDSLKEVYVEEGQIIEQGARIGVFSHQIQYWINWFTWY